MKKFRFNPQLLVDDKGNPVAVQLDIRSYEALLEELQDLYDVRQAEKILKKKAKTYTLKDLEESILHRGK